MWWLATAKPSSVINPISRDASRCAHLSALTRSPQVEVMSRRMRASEFLCCTLKFHKSFVITIQWFVLYRQFIQQSQMVNESKELIRWRGSCYGGEAIKHWFWWHFFHKYKTMEAWKYQRSWHTQYVNENSITRCKTLVEVHQKTWWH